MFCYPAFDREQLSVLQTTEKNIIIHTILQWPLYMVFSPCICRLEVGLSSPDLICLLLTKKHFKYNGICWILMMSIFLLKILYKNPYENKNNCRAGSKRLYPRHQSTLLCFQGWLRSCGNKVSPLLQHVDLNVEVLCWSEILTV